MFYDVFEIFLGAHLWRYLLRVVWCPLIFRHLDVELTSKLDCANQPTRSGHGTIHTIQLNIDNEKYVGPGKCARI
jgi:hypothetical protein